MNSLTWDNRQFLAEVNQDLSIPLSFKAALQEFHAEALQAIQLESQLQKRTLLEFTHLPLADLKTAFVNLGPADVNKVNLVTDVIKPGEPKAVIPQGLISAISNFITKSLAQGFDKIPIFRKGPQWIATRRRLLRIKDPALLARLDRLFAIGGKISSVVFIVASALAIMVGLPIPYPVYTIGGSLLIKLAVDLAQGKRYSEALANFTKNVGVAVASGWAVNEILSSVDSAWPAVKDFVTSNAERLGLTGAQTQAVANANSLSQIPSVGADGPDAGGTRTGSLGPTQGDIGATMGAPTPTATTPAAPAQGDIGATMGSPTPAAPTPTAPITNDVAAANAAAPYAGELQTAGRRLIAIPQDSTLSQLAQQYKVSVNQLMQLNPQLSNADVIKAGAQLIIPPETGSPVYDRGVGLPRRR